MAVVSGSSWTELRYTNTHILPEPDGPADELDPIVSWVVHAVEVFDDGREVVLGRGDVMVFECRGRAPVHVAARALGGDVETAVDTLLTDDGRLREDLGGAAVDRVLLFPRRTSDPDGAERGIALRSVDVVRRRLAPGRTLIAARPDPYTDDPDDPEFLRGVPEPVRAGWFARGLTHAGHGIWTLPPRED